MVAGRFLWENESWRVEWVLQRKEAVDTPAVRH